MALILCSECGKPISDTAKRCVHCGCEFVVCKECGTVRAERKGRCACCGYGEESARTDETNEAIEISALATDGTEEEQTASSNVGLPEKSLAVLYGQWLKDGGKKAFGSGCVVWILQVAFGFTAVAAFVYWLFMRYLHGEACGGDIILYLSYTVIFLNAAYLALTSNFDYRWRGIAFCEWMAKKGYDASEKFAEMTAYDPKNVLKQIDRFHATGAVASTASNLFCQDRPDIAKKRTVRTAAVVALQVLGAIGLLTFFGANATHAMDLIYEVISFDFWQIRLLPLAFIAIALLITSGILSSVFDKKESAEYEKWGEEKLGEYYPNCKTYMEQAYALEED